jgi:N-acetylmuramoyl-L-alanine amidase
MSAATKYVYINYQKTGVSGAVITIGLTAQFQYKADKTGEGLVISFVWPSYKNIRYYNNYDRVHFLIKKASLTTGTKNLKPLYTYSKDRTGHVHTITFPSTSADINEGMLDIGDEYLRSFEVRKNDNGTTSLIFTGYPENDYVVFTRESGDTAITVVKQAASGQKLVVIDAGHGGTAIGTAYGKLIEKNLNLDIAKRIESLLREKGVQMYMLRSDDSNVDNYERVYIANALRASLYLSIHINGTNSKKTDGTMTLYCPTSKSGFTGRDFAQIIQQGMLSALKTTNRGLRTRPDLIVLRETNMPAALAEVAFLTNAADRNRLSTDAFRQKAAQSLSDSVIKALKRSNKRRKASFRREILKPFEVVHNLHDMIYREVRYEKGFSFFMTIMIMSLALTGCKIPFFGGSAEPSETEKDRDMVRLEDVQDTAGTGVFGSDDQAGDGSTAGSAN